jgi:hypothetical protein
MHFAIIWSRRDVAIGLRNRPHSKLLRELHLLLTLALGKKTESISLRVTAEVKKAVERAARCQQLTTAGLVERVLIEGLRQCGYLQQTKGVPHAADAETGEPTIR